MCKHQYSEVDGILKDDLDEEMVPEVIQVYLILKPAFSTINTSVFNEVSFGFENN
jgi:hypothetical protein